MRLLLKIVGCVLLFFFVIFAIQVYQTGAPLRHAREVATTHEQELRREAGQLLRDAQTSGIEPLELTEESAPHYFSMLKPQHVWVSPHKGSVQVQVRGGFVHEGLVLVDDPTTFSTDNLPKGHRKLSEFIWEYRF